MRSINASTRVDVLKAPSAVVSAANRSIEITVLNGMTIPFGM
jgi:hypothetical protein